MCVYINILTGPIPSPVVHVTARAMTSRKVIVEWETSNEHDYLNVTYIVSIADATGRYLREEEVALNRCVIRNLTESTEYRVYVVAVTPEGLRSSESDVISFETEKSLPQPTLRTLFWNDTVMLSLFHIFRESFNNLLDPHAKERRCKQKLEKSSFFRDLYAKLSNYKKLCMFIYFHILFLVMF